MTTTEIITTDQAPSPAPRGPRLVPIVAGVAVLCLAGGLVAGHFVESPAQAAANVAPPHAGPVTALVEKRAISNDVLLRADAVYSDAVDVRPEAGDGTAARIVTGHVPAVGAQVGPADVLLEIAGRPVIVLPGDLPVYRTLRAGTAGPDVLQLKAALTALGIDAGNKASDVYDAATAAGVDALYAKVGYGSPAPDETATSALKTAREAVRSAEAGVRDAQTALTTAGKGPTDVQKLEADNAVKAAERDLATAQAAQAAQDAAQQQAQAPIVTPAPDAAQTPVTPAPDAAQPVDVAGAQDRLALAKANRAALDAPVDTSAAKVQLTNARQALTDAQADLTTAQAQTLTSLPAGEVVFLSGLPRRVDAVKVQRGGLVDGVVASVSGATLVLQAQVPSSDAALLKVGAVGEVQLPDGTTGKATVTAIGGDAAAAAAPTDPAKAADKPTAARTTVTLEPKDLTPAQIDALRGQNVRVKVSVGATNGEVLAVPVAALTAGSGGESRVEVRRGTGDATELVTVKTGLAAGGFVEIVSADGALDVGDKVVVGR